MREKISYQAYKEMFKQDKDGKFLSLIIPKNEKEEELNLIGKAPSEFTVDEIIRMKKYSASVFKNVEESTIR